MPVPHLVDIIVANHSVPSYHMSLGTHRYSHYITQGHIPTTTALHFYVMVNNHSSTCMQTEHVTAITVLPTKYKSVTP